MTRIRPNLLILAASTLLTLPASATIDTMFVNHVQGPALCGSFGSNPEIDYGNFMSRGQRITVPRGATFLVELDGFGADLATGVQESVSGLSASISGHGTHNSPSGGTFFGQPAQTGFVTVQIVVGSGAALGDKNVQVNWLTGHEIIPLTIVAACNPTPTPVPHAPPPPPVNRPIGAGAAPPPQQLPDLTPTDFVNFRTCNPSSFGTCVPLPADCNGAFTGQRTFTQPDLQYGVRNISGVAVTTPFAVLLRKDGVQLAKVTVPNLAANATATFAFHRPNSNVCVQQVGPNKVCNYCAVAIDDTGIEVVVDSDGAITEASETNNSRKVQ
ncbi:MAG TPA: CARDB domain-containing protein [Thermoanaerobaculia bacterium]|nr:CARDB domain-containing protein [Thermoanaerobaculia bacterium]